ncbi:MAG TPA: hypothetical protein VGK88_00385 [bacterium]
MKSRFGWMHVAFLIVAAALIVPLQPAGIGAAPALTLSVQMVAHLAGCVDRNQVMRGDQVIWLIKATNAAAQEITSGLDMTVFVGKYEVKATYNPGSKFWAAPLPIVWDMPTGNLPWHIVVKNAQGTLTDWKPASYMTNRLLTIIPGPIKVDAQLTDTASGNPVTEARAGASLRIGAKISRPARGDAYAYGKADRELTGTGIVATKGAPLTQDVTVRAIIGQGSFAQGTQTFSGGVLATVPLAYDLAREIWRASFTVPAGAAPGSYSVAIFAKDKFDNTGFSLSTIVFSR